MILQTGTEEEKASDHIFSFLLEYVCYFSAVRCLVFFFLPSRYHKQTFFLPLKKSAVSVWCARIRLWEKLLSGRFSERHRGPQPPTVFSTAAQPRLCIQDSTVQFPLTQRRHTWPMYWKRPSWLQMLCLSEVLLPPGAESRKQKSKSCRESWCINLEIQLICMIKVAL